MTHPTLIPPREPALAGNAAYSLDVEEADRAADKAINFQLGTTTLAEFASHTRQISGQIELFADALRDGGSVTGRASWLEAQQLLAGGPASKSLSSNCWRYARDLGLLLRRLATEYRELENGSPALPTRPPRASLDRITASRQTYLVPSGLAPAHKPLPTASER
ncbi:MULTISPECIES: hypothetical protein [unclassified Streptomyces]|uniref:hypothetical protein n=1 Tax=unclassified Streptomyces TaxID=2593676 RepID=UPI00344E1441